MRAYRIVKPGLGAKCAGGASTVTEIAVATPLWRHHAAANAAKMRVAASPIMRRIVNLDCIPKSKKGVPLKKPEFRIFMLRQIVEGTEPKAFERPGIGTFASASFGSSSGCQFAIHEQPSRIATDSFALQSQ